ncbi:MAG: aminopeptidase, partial [Eubacterium sp.]|nr:aminopeptidase [Eubacterium sp.]
WDMLVGLELFLQVYGEFEDGDTPAAENIRKILYWYVNDYCQEMVEERVAAGIDPARDFAVRLIMESDLSDLRYLYQFGEYVTGQEEKTAAFLNTLPLDEVQAMARTYTEGYRIGFEVAGKDISKKKTVNIRYCLGFERMVREAVLQFEQMGLQPVIYRAATHAVNKRQHIRVGYYGAIPNPQYDYDHRNDSALFLDEEFVSRKLRALRGAYEKYKELAAWHGGPAVIEIFGMVPFVPETCRDSVTMTEKQQKLQVHLNNESGQITNRYIKGDERSFTIIAYPVPAIGEQFEEIFRETVKINTLDYNLYREIQQNLIDALDQGTSVHIVGNNGNHTDLRVQLHKLQNPEKETNFENCVADVNIPVGEVFTSPVLEGTNGVLHVTSVYLEELQYQNLELKFENGRITEYSCTNFPEEAENKAYISENILHHHPSLPLGEFAIGTNTTAYRMAKDYGIEDKLPILIAEKMGPHFAVGDTCYSWSEDTPVYNPDGKEIIARDNEQSLLRKTDPGKAYLGCHTDITIPYDELGLIVVEREDGSTVELIRDGKFVLAGTEILNKAL